MSRFSRPMEIKVSINGWYGEYLRTTKTHAALTSDQNLSVFPLVNVYPTFTDLRSKKWSSIHSSQRIDNCTTNPIRLNHIYDPHKPILFHFCDSPSFLHHLVTNIVSARQRRQLICQSMVNVNAYSSNYPRPQDSKRIARVILRLRRLAILSRERT